MDGSIGRRGWLLAAAATVTTGCVGVMAQAGPTVSYAPHDGLSYGWTAAAGPSIEILAVPVVFGQSFRRGEHTSYVGIGGELTFPVHDARGDTPRVLPILGTSGGLSWGSRRPRVVARDARFWAGGRTWYPAACPGGNANPYGGWIASIVLGMRPQPGNAVEVFASPRVGGGVSVNYACGWSF